MSHTSSGEHQQELVRGGSSNCLSNLALLQTWEVDDDVQAVCLNKGSLIHLSLIVFPKTMFTGLKKTVCKT